jgi:integrase
MVYKRKGGKSLTFMGRLPGNRWKQLSTGTPRKALAQRIAAMWESLAVEYRAWDLLEHVLTGRMKIGTLFDLWTGTRYNPVEMRLRLADRDLDPLVEDWIAVYRRKHPDTDSPEHALAHVGFLLPEGSKRLVSEVTTEWLTERLYAYPGKPGTLKKVHSSWSVFLGYCTKVRGLFTANPMLAVEPPSVRRAPVQFYELHAVERIVNAQPTPACRALLAFLYGSATEVSVALALTRSDLDPARREVRAAGTKAHTRDRVSLVADWAWPMVWGYAKTHLPTARLWSFTRWTVSDWQRATALKLGLAPLPLKNARHHWAVRMLRAGTPVAIVQRQLGHATAKLTLDTYGAFVPSGGDRAHWDAVATRYDKAKREAEC